MKGGGICLVPLDLPGVSRGQPLKKLGSRDLNQGEIFFEDVRIPREFMICEPENYEAMTDFTLATANAAVGILYLGAGRAAFEEALRYATERVQGGKPLVEHQLIRAKLFDMFMDIEAARSLARTAMVYNYTSPSVVLNMSLLMTAKATRLKKLKYNSTVEIVHQDTALLGTENHPIHLHGYNFFVIGQGMGTYDPAVAEPSFNLVNPVTRNTVAVLAGGWAVIRLVANNPGKQQNHPVKSLIFISNHRDIVLDSTLINYLLHKYGHKVPYIAIGDNLLINDLVSDLFKVNKCFIVKRELPMREQLKESGVIP